MREYSKKPDAQYSRLRYRTDDRFRLSANQRNREWREKMRANGTWKRYESVRVMINTQRARIARTEERLTKQERRLVALCREFVRLKKLFPDRRRKS
jgi:hypothetical protein